MANKSTTGYKANSPDRFDAYNIIPGTPQGTNLTMDGVPPGMEILGVDNLGNEQVMTEGNYTFPGSSVFEVPMNTVDNGTWRQRHLVNRIQRLQQKRCKGPKCELSRDIATGNDRLGDKINKLQKRLQKVNKKVRGRERTRKPKKRDISKEWEKKRQQAIKAKRKANREYGGPLPSYQNSYNTIPEASYYQSFLEGAPKYTNMSSGAKGVVTPNELALPIRNARENVKSIHDELRGQYGGDAWTQEQLGSLSNSSGRQVYNDSNQFLNAWNTYVGRNSVIAGNEEGLDTRISDQRIGPRHISQPLSTDFKQVIMDKGGSLPSYQTSSAPLGSNENPYFGGTVPPVTVGAENPWGPYYKYLSQEEKRYLQQNPGINNAIARNIKGKASQGYGIEGNPTFTETATDAAIGSLTGGPDMALEYSGIKPTGRTIGRAWNDPGQLLSDIGQTAMNIGAYLPQGEGFRTADQDLNQFQTYKNIQKDLDWSGAGATLDATMAAPWLRAGVGLGVKGIKKGAEMYGRHAFNKAHKGQFTSEGERIFNSSPYSSFDEMQVYKKARAAAKKEGEYFKGTDVRQKTGHSIEEEFAALQDMYNLAPKNVARPIALTKHTGKEISGGMKEYPYKGIANKPSIVPGQTIGYTMENIPGRNLLQQWEWAQHQATTPAWKRAFQKLMGKKYGVGSESPVMSRKYRNVSGTNSYPQREVLSGEQWDALKGTTSKLHEGNVIHGDLHGGNIMVTPGGKIKLIDPVGNKKFTPKEILGDWTGREEAKKIIEYENKNFVSDKVRKEAERVLQWAPKDKIVPTLEKAGWSKPKIKRYLESIYREGVQRKAAHGEAPPGGFTFQKELQKARELTSFTGDKGTWVKDSRGGMEWVPSKKIGMEGELLKDMDYMRKLHNDRSSRYNLSQYGGWKLKKGGPLPSYQSPSTDIDYGANYLQALQNLQTEQARVQGINTKSLDLAKLAAKNERDFTRGLTGNKRDIAGKLTVDTYDDIKNGTAHGSSGYIKTPEGNYRCYGDTCITAATTLKQEAGATTPGGKPTKVTTGNQSFAGRVTNQGFKKVTEAQEGDIIQYGTPGRHAVTYGGGDDVYYEPGLYAEGQPFQKGSHKNYMKSYGNEASIYRYIGKQQELAAAVEAAKRAMDKNLTGMPTIKPWEQSSAVSQELKIPQGYNTIPEPSAYKTRRHPLRRFKNGGDLPKYQSPGITIPIGKGANKGTLRQKESSLMESISDYFGVNTPQRYNVPRLNLGTGKWEDQPYYTSFEKEWNRSGLEPTFTFTSAGGPGVGTRWYFPYSDPLGIGLETDIDPTGPGGGILVANSLMKRGTDYLGRKFGGDKWYNAPGNFFKGWNWPPGYTYGGFEYAGNLPAPFMGATVTLDDTERLQHWLDLPEHATKKKGASGFMHGLGPGLWAWNQGSTIGGRFKLTNPLNPMAKPLWQSPDLFGGKRIHNPFSGTGQGIGGKMGIRGGNIVPHVNFPNWTKYINPFSKFQEPLEAGVRGGFGNVLEETKEGAEKLMKENKNLSKADAMKKSYSNVAGKIDFSPESKSKIFKNRLTQTGIPKGLDKVGEALYGTEGAAAYQKGSQNTVANWMRNSKLPYGKLLNHPWLWKGLARGLMLPDAANLVEGAMHKKGEPVKDWWRYFNEDQFGLKDPDLQSSADLGAYSGVQEWFNRKDPVTGAETRETPEERIHETTSSLYDKEFKKKHGSTEKQIKNTYKGKGDVYYDQNGKVYKIPRETKLEFPSEWERDKRVRDKKEFQPHAYLKLDSGNYVDLWPYDPRLLDEAETKAPEIIEKKIAKDKAAYDKEQYTKRQMFKSQNQFLGPKFKKGGTLPSSQNQETMARQKQKKRNIPRYQSSGSGIGGGGNSWYTPTQLDTSSMTDAGIPALSGDGFNVGGGVSTSGGPTGGNGIGLTGWMGILNSAIGAGTSMYAASKLQDQVKQPKPEIPYMDLYQDQQKMLENGRPKSTYGTDYPTASSLGFLPSNQLYAQKGGNLPMYQSSNAYIGRSGDGRNQLGNTVEEQAIINAQNQLKQKTFSTEYSNLRGAYDARNTWEEENVEDYWKGVTYPNQAKLDSIRTVYDNLVIPKKQKGGNLPRYQSTGQEFQTDPQTLYQANTAFDPFNQGKPKSIQTGPRTQNEFWGNWEKHDWGTDDGIAHEEFGNRIAPGSFGRDMKFAYEDDSNKPQPGEESYGMDPSRFDWGNLPVYEPSNTDVDPNQNDYTIPSAFGPMVQKGGYLPSYEGGGYMGINPAHKGYCTPMSKSTCTPPRKALARRLKPGGDLYRGKKAHGGDLIEPNAEIEDREVVEYTGKPAVATNGGSMTDLANNYQLASGATHEQGGIDVAASGGFVFSDTLLLEETEGGKELLESLKILT